MHRCLQVTRPEMTHDRCATPTASKQLPRVALLILTYDAGIVQGRWRATSSWNKLE